MHQRDAVSKLDRWGAASVIGFITVFALSLFIWRFGPVHGLAMVAALWGGVPLSYGAAYLRCGWHGRSLRHPSAVFSIVASFVVAFAGAAVVFYSQATHAAAPMEGFMFAVGVGLASAMPAFVAVGIAEAFRIACCVAD